MDIDEIGRADMERLQRQVVAKAAGLQDIQYQTWRETNRRGIQRPEHSIKSAHPSGKAVNDLEAERREPSGELMPLTHRRACALPLQRPRF
jgi:hypothetical protein